MRRRFWVVVLMMVILTLAAAGCASEDAQPTATVASSTAAPADTPTAAPPTATPLSEPLFLLARVESLEVLSSDDEPTNYAVRLRGTTSNSCSQVDEPVTELKGSVYTIAVLEVQNPPEPGQQCLDEETPFDITVDLSDVAPGSYTVSAQGLQGSFTVADAAVSDQEPLPTSTAPATGSISGTVWHDLCQGRGDVEAQTPAGCVADEEGALSADGLFDDEPGVPGVRVGIAAGDCAAPATDFTTTDADGKFTFDDLPVGTYCVSVDALDEQNVEVLNDGSWTSPAGEAEQLVTFEDATGSQEVNFGWDFAFLPLAPYDPETCLNSLAYLEDINIADDTEFAPNQAFTKRWLLQNNGTCPWTDAYSIVFVGGDQMSAPDTVPLPRPVAPGQTIEVAVDMVSPGEAGTYRGNWQIADANGEPFGIDGLIEDAFWLRIVVVEDGTVQATPADGTGTIGGVVWDDFCLNSDPGTGCIEFPEASGIFIADGTFGSSESALAGITISLATQSCPADGSLPPAEQVLETDITSENGQYRFQGLVTGMYCIFMDALGEENVDLLIPGNWTYPATGVGRYTFFLDPGEQALDLDFGWDYAD
jgi:hypothetical protein